MRKYFVWTLVLAASLQVVLMANGLHQFVRFDFADYNSATGEYTADITPLAALELNISNNTIEALNWAAVGLIAGAILMGFMLRARAVLVGIAAASFAMVLFFAGILPYSQGDALVGLGTVAIIATGMSAVLEWRGGTFYKDISAAAERYPKSVH